MELGFNISCTSSFLSTGSFNIHYVHKGSGPPLILLHGGGTWLYSFRHNINSLSQDFSVFAPDLPGYGYTKPVTNNAHYNVDTICQAILDFMDKLKIERSHFVGHSWGGGWAIFFASRFPERVSKLVLIDSSGLNKREQLVWEFMKIPFVGEFVFKLINTYAIRKGLEENFYDKALVTDEMVANIQNPLQNPENRKAQLSYSRDAGWQKTQKSLVQIKSPTLIIWGKHDRYINVNYGRQMADLMPHARLVILEDCGHSPHEECPDTVNRLIIDFLTS